jgi:protein-S-isoprenylcysteine O-methyltransferase Ste14
MRPLLATLELRLPPPLVAVLCIGLMLTLARALPAWQYPFPGRLLVGGLVATAGLALVLAGIRALRRAGTTVSPVSPHKTTVLVVHGIYGRTRNPMYLGLALLLVGIAIALANPVALVGPVLFVIWIDRFQIRPEERVLAERMGSVYTDYLASTPRWL